MSDVRPFLSRASTGAPWPISSEARGQLEDSASAWAGLALTLARQGDAAAAHHDNARVMRFGWTPLVRQERGQ